MKTMMFYTQSYEQALRAFLTEAAVNTWLAVRYEGTREGLFFTCCAYESLTAEPMDALVSLLEYIAIQENPVYKHSAKLTGLALELKQTAVHTDNIRRLGRYLKQNRALHLEGYVTFRMPEYTGRLDEIMYSLIKKLKLTEQ